MDLVKQIVVAVPHLIAGILAQGQSCQIDIELQLFPYPETAATPSSLLYNEDLDVPSWVTCFCIEVCGSSLTLIVSLTLSTVLGKRLVFSRPIRRKA